MHELCDACQSASYCRQSGCIPLVTDETVEFGTQVDWFDTLFLWLGLALAGGFFLLVLALSAGWMTLK